MKCKFCKKNEVVKRYCEYCSSKCYYKGRPEAYKRHLAWCKEYRNKPENKAKQKESAKKYYKKNAEKLREKFREYYSRTDVKEKREKYLKKPEVIERYKEYHKKWYQENKDRARESCRRNREKNKLDGIKMECKLGQKVAKEFGYDKLGKIIEEHKRKEYNEYKVKNKDA